MAITKLDLSHTEDNFISQISALRKRVDALERQAIKVDENNYTLPVGGINCLKGFFTLGVPENAVIDGGDLVISKSYVLVDTEGAAATDNLDWIMLDIMHHFPPDGTLLVIQAADATNTVVLRDESGIAGDGNLKLVGASRSLDHTSDSILLVYNATLAQWCEVSWSDNA